MNEATSVSERSGDRAGWYSHRDRAKEHGKGEGGEVRGNIWRPCRAMCPLLRRGISRWGSELT
jgi:hypothetical protein